MVILLTVGAWVVALGALGGTLAVYRRISGLQDRAESALVTPSDLSRLQEDIAEEARSRRLETDVLVQRLDTMTHAIAEGIERVDRSERRVKAAVRGAQKRLAEHGYVDDGLEAEASQLRLIDGGGGDEGGVSSVPPSVGAPSSGDSSIPGVSREQLLRIRGF